MSAYREKQRITDGASIVRPAGAVLTIIEIIIPAALDVVPVMVLVGRIQMLSLLLGGPGNGDLRRRPDRAGAG